MAESLSVRKTLVLGLGSTGLHVAQQLAEHLTWQYGGFDRASWVRLLVLETAQPQTKLGRPGPLGQMTKREDQAPAFSSPRTTGAEFGFYEWQDGPTLLATSTTLPTAPATAGCWAASASSTRAPTRTSAAASPPT